MSGSVLSLFAGATAGSASGLLSILYGGGARSGAAVTANPVLALQHAQQTESQGVASEAAQPQVARDIAAFRNGVAHAKSVQDLLANPAVLKVLLTANGLGDQTGYPALAAKALASDPSDATSLVNRLSNTVWKSTAQTYQFATKGLSVIQDPAVQTTLANAYAEVLWRQSLDASTPGLSNALTFQSEASTITSADQILGDSTLRTVVTTALGIPEQIAFQPLEAQEKAITSRLDIAKFRDPAFVARFTQQYLVAAQQSSSSAGGGGSDITRLAVTARGLVV